MRGLDNFGQVIPLPCIYVPTQGPGVGDVVGSKGQTQHGLNLPHFTEHSLLGVKGVAAQRPELDVFDATTDDQVRLVWMKLDIEYLKIEKICNYELFMLWYFNFLKIDF